MGFARQNLQLKGEKFMLLINISLLASFLVWFFVIFVGLMLITYIPQISLWLPNLMMGS
jgi:TRAP-type C4-dicarboxylate transport system permease large subunit